MVIKKEIKNKIVRYYIEGAIDSDSYHDFESEVLSLDYDGVTIFLDFNEVSYITSAAIRVLLVMRKNVDKENIIILNANKDIKEIFKSAGFYDMLTFKDEKDTDPLHKSFKTLLKDVVSLYPDREAYIMGNDRYTWSDIDKCSQIIASDLSKLGVRKGSHVGIISANSINWICTFLAVQKLGGIVCSINFNSKKEELISLAVIGDIEFLCYGKVTAISEQKTFFENEIFEMSCIKKVYNIEPSIDFRKRYDEYDDIRDEFSDFIDADVPSLIIFTSGSTGKPKAVISSSYNRISVFQFTAKQDNIVITDKLCSCIYLPLFHIFAIMHAIIIPLLYHTKVCITMNPRVEEVLNLIYKEKCTFLPTVPTFISAMLAHSEFKPELVDSIEYIAFGGEPITVKKIEECTKKFRNAKAANGYGLSEISPISNTLYGDTFENLTNTVGHIYDFIDLKIVDMTTREVMSVGKVGEICVKAETAMIGYYKLDIDSQAIDNKGYICTGDLGYVREDGYLVLTGRCKELIIRSGENISPNEIASAIATYEDISEVKVYGVPDEKNGEAVAAAIIMKEGKSFDRDSLDTYLCDKIAKFKMPKYYVEFKSFPLLSNNKIDGVSIRKEMIERLGLKK